MTTPATPASPRVNRLGQFLRELYRRSRVLAITGWIHLALLAGVLVIFPFDSRLVMGINVWIKPIKFAMSIAIYVWTVAWLLEYLRLPSWAKRTISWGIAISMLTEIACITTQAARGTTSHYNVNTPFDAAIFSIMGSMIALNSVLALILLICFLTGRYDVSSPYLWGIRSGLVIFSCGFWHWRHDDRPRIAFGGRQGWRSRTSHRELEYKRRRLASGAFSRSARPAGIANNCFPNQQAEKLDDQSENRLCPCSFWRVCPAHCTSVFPSDSWLASTEDVMSYVFQGNRA